jgi:hypothetical protein
MKGLIFTQDTNPYQSLLYASMEDLDKMSTFTNIFRSRIITQRIFS